MNRIELPEDHDLNIEGYSNKPVCPVCQAYLEKHKPNYKFARTDPDTRWFWCEGCQGHLGYHRMKAKWKVDPYDLNTSPTFREHFGITE